MVEGGGLENRCTRKGTVGSNPTSSANSINHLADLKTDSPTTRNLPFEVRPPVLSS